MKKEISGEGVPLAVGPYSAAIKVGNMIFTSGQLPINPATNELVNDNVKKATKQIFDNIKVILEKEGFSLDDIVKVTVFSSSMSYFAEFNEYYSTLFNKPFPARSFIEVSKLPKDALIEIEVIAIKE
ncbi:MAG TPA: Rid family detoxifying hydrolase [Exilispira sp.]|nr:Rid family detoxifying hydrolase [Exilispira sp.]